MEKALIFTMVFLLESCFTVFALTAGGSLDDSIRPRVEHQRVQKSMPANWATPPSNPSSLAQAAQPRSGDQRGERFLQVIAVEGCLSQNKDGKFIIADDGGSVSELVGNVTPLPAMVGQKIRVDGMTADAAISTQIRVTKVKTIARNCSASRGGH